MKMIFVEEINYYDFTVKTTTKTLRLEIIMSFPT